MTVPGCSNPLLMYGNAGAYQISRSLRFSSGDSSYLSRTPASASNRRTWTWAGWVKRGAVGSGTYAIADARTGSNESPIMFGETTADTLSVYEYNGGFIWQLRTTQVFRDPSAWFHLCIAVDTTQATTSNRVKIYVNGSEVTAFAVSTYPSQNHDTFWNTTNVHTIGAKALINTYFSGYLADVYFIDGQALTPSSFTETDATTGQLIPKAFSGTYGTNGFHLEFADNSNNTASTLGKDTSGNGNNFSPSNFSVTAGAGNDSLVDVPTSSGTDTGVGGEVRGNYCGINPLSLVISPYTTLSNGNLDATFNNGGNTGIALGTVYVSTGKWYCEYVWNGVNDASVGIVTNTFNASYVGAANSYSYRNGGGKRANAVAASYGASYTTGDVIGVALDLDAGELTFYKNGTSQGVAYTGLSGTFTFGASSFATAAVTANFGQRPFAYTAPSGFKALNTANLPAPLITKPSTVFDTLLWTGNGSARSITGLGFNPDLVWIKSRSAATDHELTDSVRGTTKSLSSNLTAAEATDTGGLTAFNSDGFSLGTDTKYNNNAATYAGWCWDAGSSTVTNTQGSITSSVRANATAGFSIVTYTGNGSSGATIGHGLGVAPQFLLFKNRSSSADWFIYHQALGNTTVLLFTTSAQITGRGDFLNSTTPSSTLITLGNTLAVNNSSNNYVCYAFAPVVGYSSFGSYTGNGSSTDGPFVYTGFRPRWIMFKSSSYSAAETNWTIWDTTRDSYNVITKFLRADLSNGEGSVSYGDILSNGFKFRYTDTNNNFSGQTYIYAAFAEAPFNYARAR